MYKKKIWLGKTLVVKGVLEKLLKIMQTAVKSCIYVAVDDALQERYLELEAKEFISSSSS